MTRIQLALDMTPRQLANALDVTLAEVVDRDGPRSQASSFVTDPFWPALQAYVDQRLAGLIAVKDEIDRKARLDKRTHAERVAQIRNRS